ncbi:MAG: hypothetical protein ACI9R3_002890, partial [Verrucomicrobiales bacterium]
LAQAKLEQDNLEQAKLEQAKLEQAKLEQAKLEQARLEQAKLRQAKLEQAKFKQARRRESRQRFRAQVVATCSKSGAIISRTTRNIIGRVATPALTLPGKLANGAKWLFTNALQLSKAIARGGSSLRCKLQSAKAAPTATAMVAENPEATPAAPAAKPEPVPTPETIPDPQLATREKLPVQAPAPTVVHEVAPTSIQFAPRSSGSGYGSAAIKAWLPSVGIAAALALVAAGVVYDSQHDRLIFSLLSKDKESTQPVVEPVLQDTSTIEPAVASMKQLETYPVTKNEQLSGTWIAVKTVHTPPAGRSQGFHPGAAFQFERWGSLKTLISPGRKDGQPLSEAEAMGLQVHFKASYEIMGSGLVICNTEDGEILLSAHRKDEGLVLALLEPETHEPLVRIFCLPNKRLKQIAAATAP